MPTLQKHRHRKKPKYTEDDSTLFAYNKPVLSVCDVADFKIPLSYKDYRTLSVDYKTNFIKRNYEFFHKTSVDKCVKDYRLFGYLFDNCTVNTSRRKDIGYVILKEIEQ